MDKLSQISPMMSRESDNNSIYYEQIIKEAPTAISITDKNGNILFVNNHFCEITEYQAEEIIGLNASVLSFKTTPEHVYKQLWTTITQGKTWRGQLVNKRKSGTYYLADISISPLHCSDGSTLYYAVHNDITQQHQSHSHHKNQKAMFEAVLNAAPVAIALLDEKHQVLLSNRLYNNILCNIKQDPVELLLATLKENKGITSLEEWDFSNSETNSIELYIPPSKETKEHWFECILTQLPITDANAEAYFFQKNENHTVLTINERTREKYLLEEKRLDAVRLMTAESKLVHGMQEALMATVHQLQGPFNMVDAAISMLKNKSHSCPGIEAMIEAKNNGTQALREINHAIPERPDDPFQTVNVNQIIRDVTAIITPQLLKKSIQLELCLEATLESITAKPSRLLLMLKQLIENAIDSIQNAKQPTRNIAISSFSNQDEVVITIEDSGSGIPEHLRLKVFQPFFSTKPVTQSGCRGIGLAIVQQVINEHSGMITLGTSKALDGALITITLPKKQ